MKNVKFLLELILLTSLLIFIVCKQKITGPEEVIGITSPTLISPAYGSILSTRTVELIWNRVENADKYEIVVDNSNDFSSPEFSTSDVQDTAVTTTTLNAGVYYWRVRVENENWSNVWIFTISTNNPSAATLTIPANGSSIYENTFSFNWKDISGAYVYEIQIDTSSSFSNPIIYKKNLASSKFTVPEGIAPGLGPDMFFWRVRSANRLGEHTAWSTPWWFLWWLVLDVDGNIYTSVKIGSQIWMAENLKVIHYRNGDPIPYVPDDYDWEWLIRSAGDAYCDCDGNSIKSVTYGRIYNGYAVSDSRKIAPSGWHIPTDDEWKELEIFLGMSQESVDSVLFRGSDEGGKLKVTGTLHWKSPNTGATDEYGFAALGAGGRNSYSVYRIYREEGWFWAYKEGAEKPYWNRRLRFDEARISRSAGFGRSGYSIRCIKD